MELDFNWFFSTIAQCRAAIVGLFGAFIIGNLIQKESNHEIKKS